MRYDFETIVIRRDKETNVRYHSFMGDLSKPLYPEKYLNVRPYSREGIAVVQDDKGFLFIDMYGKNLIGDLRFSTVSFVKTIQKSFINNSKLEFKGFNGIYNVSKDGVYYYILLDNYKYYLIQQDEDWYDTDNFVYYSHLNLLGIRYGQREGKGKHISRPLTKIIELDTGTVLLDKKDSYLIVEIDLNVPTVFCIREYNKNIKENTYFCLSTDKFKTQYSSRESAVNALFSFDELNETIGL